MTIVTRPDLSQRTALSKSEITTAYWCELQAYHSRNDPRPWKPTPDMTFGSAIDAAVEIAITALRAGQAIPVSTCLSAAAEMALRDDQAVDLDAVERAVEQFGIAVAPQFDWSTAITQPTIRVDIDGLGACEGHPDIILGSTILDVKASGKAKNEASVYFAPELAFYALIRERETGEPVERVGYLTWLRQVKPMWQVLVVDVTDDLRAEGMTYARRQVQRRRLIDAVSSKNANPADFFSGPRFDSKCLDCAYVDVCSTGQRRLRRLQPVPDAS